ncbi:unnamed protein product [Rhizophagus irregularis]|nr:unnamed protein product [Rhizophagus irregularis]
MISRSNPCSYNIYFNILTFVTVYYYGSSEKTLFLNIFAAQIFDLRETRGTNIAFLSISCDRFMRNIYTFDSFSDQDYFIANVFLVPNTWIFSDMQNTF